MTVTVLVVDDQPLVRHAVRDILIDGGLVVAGEASNGLDAVRLAKTAAPDVVLMDIRMPELDGIAATALICAQDESAAQPRVLILTTFEEDDNVIAEPDEIVRAVRTIHAREALLSSTATRALIERSIRRGGSDPAARWTTALALLTPREREVLVLVAEGLANAEIAVGLTISPHTAKTHVNRIMSKVGARDRAQLVILGYETGLVVAGD
jgi:DNA-binding NarL/FixJ family response regulator